MGKYNHRFWHTDVWSDVSQPFTSNEKDIYLKVEMDEEAFIKYKETHGLDAEMTIEEMHKINSE